MNFMPIQTHRTTGHHGYRIYFLGVPPEALEVAKAAALKAFPGAQVEVVDRPEDILPAESFRNLIVLGDSDAATPLIAGGGFPRCAAVVMGRAPSDVVETVPPEEWNIPLLARAFRSALLEQELMGENIRLRGDLKTVARRVSHDLRTPVGCIYTTSDVFRELPAGEAEFVATMAGVIKESATEISRIVDRVSLVLKASADSAVPGRVDLGGILATVLQQLDGEIQTAGAQVTMPSSWPEVSGVTNWLQAVWLDLIRNAVQHGGPSARVAIVWSENNGAYRFSVADQGKGVPEARLGGLFCPFDQLHERHVPGLGLSLVERLVSLQGGRCGYEKPAGGGASFFFTLPSNRPN